MGVASTPIQPASYFLKGKLVIGSFSGRVCLGAPKSVPVYVPVASKQKPFFQAVRNWHEKAECKRKSVCLQFLRLSML